MQTYYMQNVPSVPVRAEPLGIVPVQVGYAPRGKRPKKKARPFPSPGPAFPKRPKRPQPPPQTSHHPVVTVKVGAPISVTEARQIQSLARGRWSRSKRDAALRVLKRHGFRGMGRAQLSATPADQMRARLAQMGVQGVAAGTRLPVTTRVVHQVTRTRSGGFRGKNVVVTEQPNGPRGRCGALKCSAGYEPTWSPEGYCFCGNTRPLAHR